MYTRQKESLDKYREIDQLILQKTCRVDYLIKKMETINPNQLKDEMEDEEIGVLKAARERIKWKKKHFINTVKTLTILTLFLVFLIYNIMIIGLSSWVSILSYPFVLIMLIICIYYFFSLLRIFFGFLVEKKLGLLDLEKNMVRLLQFLEKTNASDCSTQK